jgi:hemoglobin
VAGASPAPPTLYEKYGGFAAISQVVHAFYDKVVATPQLDHYFARVNMERLIAHQTRFLCKVLGGPDPYTGRTLAAAHRGRGITAAAFAEVARLLAEALHEAGVEAADVAAILDVVATTRPDVVDGERAS